MWMNQYDVEDCRPQTQALRHGAEFLKDFMELINSISDGWAYWSHGTKCSNDLQTLLQLPPGLQSSVSEIQVTAAQKKVLTFLRRCKQTKNNPVVQEFIKERKI